MEISAKQREVLEFMIRYQEEKGYPPAVREICAAVGLSSTSTVHGHLSRLEAKGYIRRDPSKPRAIEIVRHPEQDTTPLYAPKPNKRNSFGSNRNTNAERGYSQTERTVAFQNNKFATDLIAVPIIERVRAGEPILAIDNIIGYFPLPSEATRNSECFMFRVQGESMIKAGIYEGDLILVRSQRNADNGDIVVTLLGDSVSVMSYHKEREFVRLQPENDFLTPIWLKECTILGKVIGLYRTIH